MTSASKVFLPSSLIIPCVRARTIQKGLNLSVNQVGESAVLFVMCPTETMYEGFVGTVRVLDSFLEMANNVSTLSDLPYDVKSGILVKLKDTRDILNVALTSHHFYDLAMPFLFRNVNWIVGFNQEERSPNATLEAVRFLCRHPEFLSATQSLRISEKNSGPDTDIRLPMNYSIREFPSLPGRRQCRLMDETFPPTFNMTQQTLSLLPFFTNLREMTLRSISLPRDFYQSVYELSTNHQLRSITLRWCRLTTRFPRGYDPSMLQLRDLTILQVCHGPLTSLGKLKAVLKLARSQTLNTLRIDRSVEPALESLAQYGLPRSLENLELDFRGNAQRWRRSFEGLFRFLNNCFFVKHLELTDMGKLEGVRDYPSALKLKPDSLPSMVSFKGPASYLGLFVPCRPVNTITITDVITNHPPVVKYMKMEDVVEILQLLKRSRISLQTFRFNIRQWDRELFYMLSVMMRKALELYICYQAGVPDDVSDIVCLSKDLL